MITDLIILLDKWQHASILRWNSLKWYPHNKANFLQWTRRPLYANHFGTCMNDASVWRRPHVEWRHSYQWRWTHQYHIMAAYCFRVDLRESASAWHVPKHSRFKDAMFSWEGEDTMQHKYVCVCVGGGYWIQNACFDFIYNFSLESFSI
jgi:hypothetical protein